MTASRRKDRFPGGSVTIAVPLNRVDVGVLMEDTNIDPEMNRV